MNVEKLHEQFDEYCSLKWPTILGIGALAVTLAVARFDVSGETNVVRAAHQQQVQVENTSIVSANAHDELPENMQGLKDEIVTESPSIVMMQEVSHDSLDSLQLAFPEWSMAFVYGDARQKVLRGGLGNLIMTRGKMESIKSLRIEKTTQLVANLKVVEGVAKDLLSLDVSLPRAKKASVEERAVLALTTEVTVDGKPEEIQIVTSHIARQDGVRQEQLQAVTHYLEDISHDADSTIFCGDLNTNPMGAITAFAKIGFVVIPASHKTYIGSKKGSIVDHCAFYAKGRLGYEKTLIAKKFRTDHRPIRIEPKILPGIE